MRVRLLGTGAADGIPGWLSDSEVSVHARAVGGREIRSRSAALLDGHLKIDLPPDTAWQMARDNLNACDWTALVFTHSHNDHLAVDELQYGMFPFNENAYLPFPVYGNRTVCEIVRARYPAWPIEVVETRCFEPFVHIGTTVTPVRAHHGGGAEDTQNLLFERDGRTLLYATDTGIWREPTWEFLQGRQVNALVIECTEGLGGTNFEGHLDVDECFEVVRRLRTMGTLQADSRVWTTHHSQQGRATHAQLVQLLQEEGILAGYDGLEIDV